MKIDMPKRIIIRKSLLNRKNYMLKEMRKSSIKLKILIILMEILKIISKKSRSQ